MLAWQAFDQLSLLPSASPSFLKGSACQVWNILVGEGVTVANNKQEAVYLRLLYSSWRWVVDAVAHSE